MSTVPQSPDAGRPVRALSTRTAAVTSALQLGARVGGVAVTVATLAVITRTLGPVRFADWATVVAIVTALAFLPDSGISPVMVRRITQQTEGLPSPWAILRVRLLLAVVAWFLVVVVAVVLRGGDTLLLAVVLGAQLVPRAAVSDAGAWLQAEHRLHVQLLLEVAATSIGLGLLTVAATAGADAAGLAALGVLVPLTLLAIVVQFDASHRRRRFPLPPRPTAVDRGITRSVLREAVPLAVALILVSLYTRVNLVFINMSEDSTTVATFLYAFQLVEQTIVFGGMIAAVLLPLLAVSALDIPLDRAPVVRELVLGLALLGGIGAAVVIAFGETLVIAVSGPEYAPAGHFLLLLAPAVVALLESFLFGYVFVVMGRSGRYMRYNAIGLALVVAANLLFTLRFGADASARISWMVEMLVVVMAAAPFLVDRSGRVALREMLAVFALVVVACELVAAGLLEPAVASVPLALMFGSRATLLWLARRRRLAALVV